MPSGKEINLCFRATSCPLAKKAITNKYNWKRRCMGSAGVDGRGMARAEMCPFLAFSSSLLTTPATTGSSNVIATTADRTSPHVRGKMTFLLRPGIGKSPSTTT